MIFVDIFLLYHWLIFNDAIKKLSSAKYDYKLLKKKITMLLSRVDAVSTGLQLQKHWHGQKIWTHS